MTTAHSRVLPLLAILAFAAGCSSSGAKYYSEPTSEMGRSSYGMVAAESADAPSAVEAEPERMLIRTATVRFETDEPDRAVETAIERTKTRGGWVQQSGKGYVTVRIPDRGLEEFLTAIEDLGEIEDKEISGRDVTSQYRDTKIRLENLESAHRRYQGLLEQATTVSETLSVEKELERVVTEIEVLKGRVQYLEKQVAFSTVTLRFRKASKPGPLAWPFVALYLGVKWLFVWD